MGGELPDMWRRLAPATEKGLGGWEAFLSKTGAIYELGRRWSRPDLHVDGWTSHSPDVHCCTSTNSMSGEGMAARQINYIHQGHPYDDRRGRQGGTGVRLLCVWALS